MAFDLDNLPQHLQSPFDAIRHTRPDGSEFWSAREMMQYLGYVEWPNMLSAIQRAKASCRNSGHDVSSIFIDVNRSPKTGGRPRLDVEMLRFGCYIVALNGDPEKPEVAAAQQYFAIQTRIAELQTVEQAIDSPRPWYERLKTIFEPHFQHLNQFHPGKWSVLSAFYGPILLFEDELFAHNMFTHMNQRPEISIGLCWAHYRRNVLKFPDVDTFAPMIDFSNLSPFDINLYDDCEWTHSKPWFAQQYLKCKSYPYLRNSPEFGRHAGVGAAPCASVADRLCLRLTGSHADIPEAMRLKLDTHNGYIPARTQQQAIEYQGRPRKPRKLFQQNRLFS